MPKNVDNSIETFVGLLEDDFWAKEWNKQTYSPLEVVLMMKANLELVQQVYDMNTSALTRDLFLNVCRNGSQPGVLGFLAEEYPEAVLGTFQSKDDLPIHYAMRYGPENGRPSEDDIIKLLEIYPEVILYSDSDGDNAWSLALDFYSYRFIKFVARKLAAQRMPQLRVAVNLNFRKRTVFDAECVQSMSPLLLTMQCHESTSARWTVDAWVKYFRLLLQNSNLMEVEMEPDFALELEEAVPAGGKFCFGVGLHHSPFESLLQLAPHCTIEILNFSFQEVVYIHGFQAFICALICCMPRLRELHLGEVDLLQAGEPLCRLLRTSQTLESLHITSNSVGDNMVPLVNELKTNTILTTFQYLHRQHIDLSAPQEHLLDVLETTNTTLEYSDISCPLGSSDPPLCLQRIKYYNWLNRCGRAAAQDTSTCLENFVKLLDPEEGEIKWGGDLDISNMHYGLLRESPGLWCGSYMIDTTTRKRKRGG